jgi:uncharacterized glyoxalase superfamily protein PhnB
MPKTVLSLICFVIILPGAPRRRIQRSIWLAVRFRDADSHCSRAREHGAEITQEPVTHPYGERLYVAQDPAGHSWTFSESVADMLPEDWGGTSEQL